MSLNGATLDYSTATIYDANPSANIASIDPNTGVTTFGSIAIGDSGSMAFMILSAALVQLMTPGLAFFYGGLVNEGSIVSTIMMCLGSSGVITLLWGLFTYSLAFGPDRIVNGKIVSVVGTTAEALVNFPVEQLRGGTQITENVYMIYQLMFAIITCAIIAGSVVQKMKFLWFIAFISLWHIIVYTPLAHWIWTPNGWLATWGVLDFAGGMVVHTSSGVSALVLTLLLGKSKHSIPDPHNVPYVILGAALLWFGWFGFNAGSAIGLYNTNGGIAGNAFVTTQFATAVAMLTWNLLEIIFNGHVWFRGFPTAVGAACGAVSGLVVITPACGFVTPMWSYFLGFIGSIIVFFNMKLMKRLGVDDRLDCYAFHGVGGITGALLTGLFATNTVNPNIMYQGSFYERNALFGKTIAAVLATICLASVGTTVIYGFLYLISRLVNDPIAIPEDMAMEPDTSQHAEKAYFRSNEVVNFDLMSLKNLSTSSSEISSASSPPLPPSTTPAPLPEAVKPVGVNSV
jgi:ammonium transporter, Amt family